MPPKGMGLACGDRTRASIGVGFVGFVEPVLVREDVTWQGSSRVTGNRIQIVIYAVQNQNQLVSTAEQFWEKKKKIAEKSRPKKKEKKKKKKKKKGRRKGGINKKSQPIEQLYRGKWYIERINGVYSVLVQW